MKQVVVITGLGDGMGREVVDWVNALPARADSPYAGASHEVRR